MTKITQCIELTEPVNFADILDEYWECFQFIAYNDTRDNSWSETYHKPERYNLCGYGIVQPRDGWKVLNPEYLYSTRYALVQDGRTYTCIYPVGHNFTRDGELTEDFMNEYDTYLTYKSTYLQRSMSITKHSFGLVDSELLGVCNYWIETKDKENTECLDLGALGASSKWTAMAVPVSI